jgi:hypothetical protein
MALYEYEKGLSDLSQKYSQDEATNAYARFISQQRFNRQRQDQTQGFQRSFPQFTGQYARRLGSGVRSGVFGSKLNEFVGDYNQTQARTEQDQAADAGQFDQGQAMRSGQYQQNLLQLQEELARQRAMQDPYAVYRGINS